MMNHSVVLTIAEIFISLVVEGVIFSMIFAYIANLSSEKQNMHLKQEMANIETQNKFIYDQILSHIARAKAELISQIKESEAKK